MQEGNEPFLSHAEPALPVEDVSRAISYWRDVLGFTNEWMWGEPPHVGGVSWHSAFVQFYLHANFNKSAHGGQYIWIRCKNIENLHKMHKERGAHFVKEIAVASYGFLEYMLQDINGHYILFAAPAAVKKPSRRAAPKVRVVLRKPTIAEYRALGKSVGWSHPAPDETVQTMLDNQIAGFVAENPATGEAIGCALVAGDGFSYFYVKDVMVSPAWQNRKIGTRIMRTLSNWLDANAPDNAFVSLFTSETLAQFYNRFDFQPGFGMVRTISKKK